MEKLEGGKNTPGVKKSLTVPECFYCRFFKQKAFGSNEGRCGFHGIEVFSGWSCDEHEFRKDMKKNWEILMKALKEDPTILARVDEYLI